MALPATAAFCRPTHVIEGGQHWKHGHHNAKQDILHQQNTQKPAPCHAARQPYTRETTRAAAAWNGGKREQQ